MRLTETSIDTRERQRIDGVSIRESPVPAWDIGIISSSLEECIEISAINHSSPELRLHGHQDCVKIAVLLGHLFGRKEYNMEPE